MEIYQNHPTILSDLVDNILSANGKCVNLLTFSDLKPQINSIFDSVFLSRFSEFEDGDTWQYYISTHYIYDTAYVPLVHIINWDSIDLGKQIYLAAPYEVSEEKFPEFDDNIPLWINHESGLLFTTINESKTFSIDNAVLTVSNGFASDVTDPRSTSNRPGAKNSGE